MSGIHSKVTSQGQISVPAVVRRRLGVGPGATLVWEERDDAYLVRRAGRASSLDVHRAVFAEQPARKPTAEFEAGVRRHLRRRHARG